ncbi:MAG: DUF4365 domain-containing protein [Dehalococcoidia bacterium]
MNRRQGFYGECVVQAIAAAAHLKISREVLEPDGVDFEIIHERSDRLPRRKRIELQVKTHSDVTRQSDGTLRIRLRRNAYHALNGRYGIELDVPRYLVLVNVPRHFSGYCAFTEGQIHLTERVYWCDLMGEPSLPDDQDSVTVSVSEGNLLTPEALVGLTCGDREEAARWMSV